MAESFPGQVVNDAIVLDEGTPTPPEGARLRIELIAETGPSRGRTLAERLAPAIRRSEGSTEDLAEQQDHYLHGRLRQ